MTAFCGYAVPGKRASCYGASVRLDQREATRMTARQTETGFLGLEIAGKCQVECT